MKEYAASIFVMAALLSVLRIVGYKSGNMERLALGIICVYVLISPLATLRSEGISGVLDTPNIEVENGASSVIENALCEGIEQAVAEEFSLNESYISVRLFGFDAETMRAEKIEIILSGSAVTRDYRAIESYVNKMEIGECRVEISFG